MSSKIKRSIIGLLLLLSIPSGAYAQSISKWRKILSPFHFNMAIGYGVTPYRNTTAAVAIFKKGNSHYVYLPGDGRSGYLIRWFNQPYVFESLYNSDEELEEIAKTNRAMYYFEGVGHTVPISLSSHVDIFKKLRIEIGSTLYVTFLKSLQANEAQRDQLGEYIDPIGRHYVLKSYLMSGFKVWDTKDYTLLFNVQAGLDFFLRHDMKGAVRVTQFPIAVGMGFTLEKHISEYFSLFGRLMYEHGNAVDKFAQERGFNINRQGVFLQLGCTLNCPEISKCTMPQCGISVKHKHSNKMYRGASIVTGRTPQEERLF